MYCSWDMTDIVWKYGEKVGTGFKCKYCREMKSGGGHAQMHAHITTSIPMCYFCFVDKYLFIVLVFLANMDWVHITILPHMHEYYHCDSIWIREYYEICWHMCRRKTLKELVLEYLCSWMVDCCMRIEVCDCICISYVILVNIYYVDQLI
jgi:hypothetical protein